LRNKCAGRAGVREKRKKKHPEKKEDFRCTSYSKPEGDEQQDNPHGNALSKMCENVNPAATPHSKRKKE
jgi:hypothetical protein